MISLQSSWQEQRKKRRQELAQRQKQVQHTLQKFQQQRQIKATQLREELQQFHLALQQETQEFLLHTNLERQIEAEQLVEQLGSFAQSLHEQTTQLIALMAAEREMMSQQLFQDLSEFHVNLSTSVALLRQRMQQRMQQLRVEVKRIQLETHEQLQVNQQKRICQQMQLMQDLSNWMASLRSEVKTYLSELEREGQGRKQQLNRMFQQEHSRRAAEMQKLFQELTDFRLELKAYCANLHKMVWGESIAPQIGNTGFEQIKPVETTKPIDRISEATTAPKRSGLPTPVQSVPKEKPTKPETAKSEAPRSVPSPLRPATPSVVLNQTLAATMQGVPNEVPVASNQALQAALKGIGQLEGDIYKHIRQHNGARLTEIETALSVNRFQVVDALRNLIKQRLITQRDRTYLIQEEVSL